MLHVTLVKIVGLEKFLDAIAAQLRFTLTHSVRIFPLLIVHMVRVEIVHVDIWHVW